MLLWCCCRYCLIMATSIFLMHTTMMTISQTFSPNKQPRHYSNNNKPSLHVTMVESTKLIGLFLAEMTYCHCEQSCGISDFFFDTIEQLLPSTTASSLQNKNYGRVRSAPTSDLRIWRVNTCRDDTVLQFLPKANHSELLLAKYIEFCIPKN